MKPAPYGPFPYSPIIERPPLRWPNEARVAFWIVPNVEFFPLTSRPGGVGPGKTPDMPLWATRDYGNRVGIFRMMALLDEFNIPATIALNSDICLHHPQIIEQGNKRGWEWMGHNKSNAFRLNEIPPEEEENVIHETLETIHKVAGTRPIGWLGSGLQETWHTIDYLAAAGCEYVSDWGPNDDQPYVIETSTKPLVCIPYSYDINDKHGYEVMHLRPGDFRDMICEQFDVLYREGKESGRVMHLAVHPYLSGLPYRINALRAAFEHIKSHRDVWFATGTEIARHYAKSIAAPVRL
jgi:allantoinase